MSYRGVFDRTIFYDPINRHSIIRVKTSDTSVPQHVRSEFKYKDHLIRFTAVGFDLPQSDAVVMELTGEWVKEDKHGYQLHVEHCREIIPPTLEGIQGYLASGLIKGIGEKTAIAIVERFGLQSLDILANTPEQLLEIRGITKERLEEIKASYAETHTLRDIMTFLSPFGVTPKTAMKLHEHFGFNSLSIMQNSPFELCRFSGFGFKKVDAIAQKIGCSVDAPMRIMGAIFHVLWQKCKEKGHLFIPKADLCKDTMRLLNAGVAKTGLRAKVACVLAELERMVLCGEVIAYKEFIYPKRSFVLEDCTAKCVAKMLMEPCSAPNISSVLASVKRQFHIRLSEKQQVAVDMVFQNNLSIITGSPGTGKTTVLKTVLEVFRSLYPDADIILCAPTGRASRRMAESTGFMEAKTLHNALGLQGGDEDGAYFSSDEPLEADLIIVDEFSMADMWLAAQLFARLGPNTKLLLVGDADQLPSVGPGNVFRELISCGLIPVTVLDEIFRQTQDSLIAHNAKLINEDKTALYYGNDFIFIDSDTEEEVAELVRQIYLEEVSQSSIERVQILSPYRAEGAASADKLNYAIREEINPCNPEIPELRMGAKSFRIGDRVMQTQNKDGISNGDVGFIRNFHYGEDGETKVTIVFSDDRTVEYGASKMGSIMLAYATTVHKAMGSEFETVIMPILAKHMILLYRNLIYTAISRARQRIFLIGEKDILFMAIHRGRIDERNTKLGSRIVLYHKAMVLQQRLEAKQPQQLKLTG